MAPSICAIPDSKEYLQRYPRSVALMGFLVAIGLHDDPPPFSERCPPYVQTMRSGGAIPPVPLKYGCMCISKRYWSDKGYPMKYKAKVSLCDTLLSRKGLLRDMGGYLMHWAAKFEPRCVLTPSLSYQKNTREIKKMHVSSV